MGSKLPQEILICGAAPPALPWQAWVDLLSWPHCSTQTRLQVPEPLAGSEGRFGCGGPPLPSSTVQATEAGGQSERGGQSEHSFSAAVCPPPSF